MSILLVPDHVADRVERQRAASIHQGAAEAVERVAKVADSLADEQDTFEAPDRSDEQATFIPRAMAGDIPDCMWERLPVPLFRTLLVGEFRVPNKIGSIERVEMYKDLDQWHVTKGRVLAINRWCWRSRAFIVIDDDGQEIVPPAQVAVGDWVSYTPLNSEAKSLFHPRTRQELRLRLLADDQVRCKVSASHDPLW